MRRRGHQASILVLVAFLCTVAGPQGVVKTGWAHGINGHVHVTAWAIDSLPDGDLKTFLSDPELRNAALFGAVFPDTAVIIDDDYGEIAHWEPFVESYIDYMRSEEAPYSERSAQKKLAFLMGIAAHGLQDELFDTLFLPLVKKHDGQEQEQADTGTDAFFVVDGYNQETVVTDYPPAFLVNLYESAFDYAISEMVLDRGINITMAYVNSIETTARAFDSRLRSQMPWTVEHYDEPHIPGSLASEVPATAAYLQALWSRLHNEWDSTNPVIHAYPDDMGQLLDFRSGSQEVWTTVVFGAGVRYGSVSPQDFTLRDATNTLIPSEIHATRWRGSDDTVGRILSLSPAADLLPQSTYTARLGPGLEQVDGRVSGTEWRQTIRTPCDQARSDCDPPASNLWRPPERVVGVGEGAAETEAERAGQTNSGGFSATVATAGEETGVGGRTSVGGSSQPTGMADIMPQTTSRRETGCTIQRAQNDCPWTLLLLMGVLFYPRRRRFIQGVGVQSIQSSGTQSVTNS